MSFTAWITVAAVLLVIEIVTPGVFFFACLSFGALLAGLSLFVNTANWVQWLVFVAVSVLSIYFVRPLALKLFKTGGKKFNADALISQKAWVLEAINPPSLGLVKVEGETWRAEAEEIIPAETYVEITAVKGTRVLVKKI
ncbi:MAG TPA: hypothetical protein DEE98_00610 [Elusimicrobia bacterium]|nr:MAG: hypothetical protein A2278_03240 [Elusimicrobia bacterium RIFOXYA12_FULL_49_49]OGS08550.1 MAG: hypothetical protein A2204_02810 [Elusimicrobia bacterium RIFOXYA1_FULL_47_7]OGS10890.1 MAG: hypothetical protein A2386_06820 [Elusimicrobia bacterium RIFOXYB1_FULL_48_9]OGS15577.1 MAG: hypothetical protein A2251_03490 [Elusimicrobia bacterium RIFOXYA2_FULL_47_53]OGS26867.1 MAG: hypothetical protein A2339_07490 [Elusimicrobia bacterium RIFOXYB12_FULL_50_12]OGS30676.1 MAG: hypothetical protein